MSEEYQGDFYKKPESKTRTIGELKSDLIHDLSLIVKEQREKIEEQKEEIARLLKMINDALALNDRTNDLNVTLFNLLEKKINETETETIKVRNESREVSEFKK